MSAKILIVTLPFSGEINHNGFTEIFGNPVRGWAAFHYFNKWGVEAHFLLPNNVKISPKIKEQYNNRFIYGYSTCDKSTLESFDYILITSTRLLHFTKNVPIAPLIAALNTKIILALCYDDTPERSTICRKIIYQAVAAGFVSPYYISDPNLSFNRCYRFKLTSGVSRVSQDLISSAYQTNQKIISFVGYIHSQQFCTTIANVAELLPSHKFQFSSRTYTDWSTREKFSILPGPEYQASVHKFLSMFTTSSGMRPKNISYEYTMELEDEIRFLASSTIGFDYCWNNQWKFDNSKVNRYLSYGLPVITTKPSLSHRHLNLFGNHGVVLPFNPNTNLIVKAVDKLSRNKYQSLAARLEVARKAQVLFDWNVVAFEIYEAFLGVECSH